MQVIAIALEDVVFLQADLDEQITRWPAIGARLAIARAADAHAVVDTRRDFDFQRFLLFDLALPVAGAARIGNDLARAAAMRAGLLHAEKALAHLHLALTLTGRAGLGAGAGFGARAVAGVALVPARNAQLRILAVGRFFERDLHGVAEVRAAKHLASTAASTAALAAKDVAKDVAKRVTKSAKAFGTTAHVGIDTRVTVLVIGCPLLRVRQHLVGFLDLFEFAFCLFGFGVIPLVAVRVVLHRQLAISLFDVFV